MRSGDGTPLFLIHPVEGIVSGYAPLVGLLEGTIYGLEAGETQAVRIETMAASYIDAIRTVQSHGPYRLIGWSMGGLIAYEMARILREHGEAIEFLAIIDQAPSAVAPPPEEANRLDSASDEELLRWRDASPLAAALPAGLTARELRVYLRNWIALRAYSPAPTDVAMLLVRSESTPATPDASLGWAALARGGVETVAVPGDHHGMMHFPHVTALAAELRKRLATRTIHP